ncbi:MAG TPA: UdgX family uracil-DNA binding protein [Actinomycetota bacterium]|nr:UdgX family uracil-DNA binding protein [Actinomycetota bacterium]
MSADRRRGVDGAAAYLPDELTLPAMRGAVDGCRGCDLWEGTTQGVMGEGLKRAEVMFVGEQPGDREDVEGRPFVGPAGKELDRGLEEAGIDRRLAYVTNTVKHFSFEQRGKRRIHRKPNAEQIRACRPWLEAELTVVRPRVLVALGATAAAALFGTKVRVTRDRGKLVPSELAPVATLTIHPSAILRAPDEEIRRLERARFAEDLRLVAAHLGG